ncbi:MAG: 4-alpha-glucanotransferase [Deltaproteobacteria bacterium]|nr:4-alpha-glucanotransferase [Deltaproteobacteria bacterium]
MDDCYRDLLARLARLCGVFDGYHDLWGNYHPATPKTQQAVLAAMGLSTGSAEELEREVREWETSCREFLCAPVLLLPEGEGQEFALDRPLPSGTQITLSLAGHDVPLTVVASTDGTPRARLPGPLPLGLYHAEVRAGAEDTVWSRRVLVAVCPDRGYEPSIVAQGGRLWGINVPLYGVRSSTNWGVGDFADLRAAVDWAADLGADFVGLLPLHALFDEAPYGLSPYYPASRLFLNPVYIAVDDVPEARSPQIRRRLASARLRSRIDALRSSELVDYPGVWALKREVLRLCHEAFLRKQAAGPTERGGAFDTWRREQGLPLERFAAFCALREHLTGPDRAAGRWQEWPPAYHVPDGPGVAAFAEEHARDVSFHAYLQWIASDQLGAAAELARRRMHIGLYLDLALGSDPSGADAWMWQDLLALEASAGCPPDPFSLLGQRWGLPPVIPERHRQAGYALFRETLRRNARRSGAVRIDHALSLWRLFWIPEGLPAAEGAYVAERPEELLPLLRLLSREEQCLVVGEDLGTIPPEVREGLMTSGFYSYRLAIFEKEWEGPYRSPGTYPRQALVSVATHDLPTLDGFWLGQDLEVKRCLGRYPDDNAARSDTEGRRWDRLRLLEALQAEHLLPVGVEPAHEVEEANLDVLAEAVHAFVARTPSALLLANLDDLLGCRDMQNLPGTLDEHPNWRRKAPVPLEEWKAFGRSNRIAAAIRREGRGGERPGTQ